MKIHDELLQKVIQDISTNHRQILDDWCKAYMAQYFKENGSCLNPGDFILNQQAYDFRSGQAGYKYWFSLKDQEDL